LRKGRKEKMKRYSVAVLCLVLIGLLTLVGCTQSAAPTKPAPTKQATQATAPTQPPAATKAKPIKIGALLDFTGPVADLGPKFKAGIELALEEADYKVAGRPVELVVEDSATSVEVAVEKFKKLAEKDQVHIVIGPLMGDAHLAISPIAKEKKVLITSLINGMYPVIKDKTYLIYPTTVEAQTYPFGKYAVEKLGYKTVVVIAADYAGKRGYAAGFVKGFKEAGGTVVQEIYAPLGTPDYSPYISQMKKADVVMYALEGPGPVSRFIYQYRQAGNKGPLITITQDGDYTPEALAELKDLALGILGEASYTWKLDNPENKKFVEAIKKKTGTVPSSAEQNAYTLTKVILAGLEKTGGDDSFDKLWPAVVSLKMNTPAGPLSFTPEGVAITNMYVTQAEKVGDKYEISAPLYTVEAVKDWRLK
jgi:branched-chain amino acid transport system substrate-binding protein